MNWSEETTMPKDKVGLAPGYQLQVDDLLIHAAADYASFFMYLRTAMEDQF
jgi:hypothetical protein